MKPPVLLIFIFVFSTIFSCKKNTESQELIPIPNGDFELWDDMPNLLYWKTNSCPACDPPWETYIVQKVQDAVSGQSAAKFIYNNVTPSYACIKFPIDMHPTHLTGYVKSNIAAGDTARIQIDLFSGSNIVDTGNFYEILSSDSYKKVEIPVSQNYQTVDSAEIRIVGGKQLNTVLYVDKFSLIRKTN